MNGVLAALPLVLTFATILRLLESLPQVLGSGLQRPDNWLVNLSALLIQASWWGTLLSIVASMLVALASVILFFYLFEKTQAPEAYFFALFAWSLSFEFLKLLIPLSHSFAWPFATVDLATRMLIAARMFGMLSLFFSALYTCGFTVQKYGLVILIIAFMSLALSSSMPVNGLDWDTALNVQTGFSSQIRLMQMALALIAIASYLVAVRIQGEKSYRNIAIGALLTVVGRGILTASDNILSMGIGLALAGIGIYIVAMRVHRLYLWL